MTEPSALLLTRMAIEAAVRVCNVRYSDAGWEELNTAISELIGHLQALGIKFNNPRIG